MTSHLSPSMTQTALFTGRQLLLCLEVFSMVKATTVLWIDTEAATVKQAWFTEAILLNLWRHLYCIILPAAAEVNRGISHAVVGTGRTGQVCGGRERHASLWAEGQKQVVK